MLNVLAHQGPITRTRRRCRADAVGDRAAGRARHGGLEYAGAGFQRRSRRRRARPARRVLAAAWARRRARRGDRGGGAQGRARAAGAGRRRRGGRPAARAHARDDPDNVVAGHDRAGRCRARRSGAPRSIPASWRWPNAAGASRSAIISPPIPRAPSCTTPCCVSIERYDLLLTPTMPVTALKVGRETPDGGDFGDDWIELVALHLSVQPDAAAGSLGAERARRQRLADGGADRRPARAPIRLVLRAARALEQALPMARLPGAI